MVKKKLSLEEKAAMDKEIANEWRLYSNDSSYNNISQGLQDIHDKYYGKEYN